MSSDFENSIIRVTSQNPENRHFGTGFFVYHDEKSSFLVTCAHVVADVGGNSAVSVDGKPGEVVTIGSRDKLDLAVLKIDGYLEKPLLKLGTCGWKGSDIVIVGFHSFGQHFSTRSLEGGLGAKRGLEARQKSDRIQAWDLEITHEPYLKDGFSGSPVVDKESENVLGIVSYKQGDGQKGLAISIEELKKIWLEMPLNLIQRCPDGDEHSDFASVLSKRAFGEELSGNLRKALQIYQRAKDLKPSDPELDSIIERIKSELQRGYVSRSGQVDLKILYHQAAQRLRSFLSLEKSLHSEENDDLLSGAGRALLGGLAIFVIAIVITAICSNFP